MRTEHYEVVIVGAGPAGCSTALWTSRLCPHLIGRTVVLERCRHPRPKVCAGGLTAQALRLLAQMGLSLNMPYTQINHIRLLFENHRADILRPDCMRVIRRERFDAMLVDAVKAANIEVREGEEVSEIGFARGMCEVRTASGRYRARVVVGADGSRGLSHRCLPEYARYPLVGLSVDTPACPGDGDDFEKGRVTVDFSCNASGVAGYVWHFPSLDGTERRYNRGIFCSLSQCTKRGDIRGAMYAGLRRRDIETGEKIRGGYGGGYHKRRPLSRPHLLLVGDAAGGNPLTGEGIAQALAYGRMAAEEIAAAFARRDFSFRSYTPRVARSDLGRNMLACLSMGRSFYPRGPAVAVPSIAADRALRKQVGDLLAGADVDASRRGILTRTLAGCLMHARPGPRDMWKILKAMLRKADHSQMR